MSQIQCEILRKYFKKKMEWGYRACTGEVGGHKRKRYTYAIISEDKNSLKIINIWLKVKREQDWGPAGGSAVKSKPDGFWSNPGTHRVEGELWGPWAPISSILTSWYACETEWISVGKTLNKTQGWVCCISLSVGHFWDRSENYYV